MQLELQQSTHKMTYEEYWTIAKFLIMHLRHVEEEGVCAMLHPYSSHSVCVCAGEQGVRRHELVNWYVKEIKSGIDSVQNKLHTEMVINHLIQHVSTPPPLPPHLLLLLSHCVFGIGPSVARGERGGGGEKGGGA